MQGLLGLGCRVKGFSGLGSSGLRLQGVGLSASDLHETRRDQDAADMFDHFDKMVIQFTSRS